MLGRTSKQVSSLGERGDECLRAKFADILRFSLRARDLFVVSRVYVSYCLPVAATGGGEVYHGLKISEQDL